MSKLYIFAIGGSGARVMRSFSMLLASGQQQMKNYDVYPIILDYDETNGDTAIATRCIENYKRIHDAAWSNAKQVEEEKKEKHEGGFFLSNLRQLKDDDEFGASSFRMIYAPKGDNVFHKYIGYNQLKGDTANTKLLMQALYNTDETSDDSEINLNMKVGFKGNPNIGSVVFHDIDVECDEFRKFMGGLNENDKVIVVGSLFGGTGSSGIPEVIRKIRKEEKGKKVKIGAVLIMPYFAPDPKPGGTIRWKIFNAKTKAAINYYYDSELIKIDDAGNLAKGSKLDSVYFIGDPVLTQLPYCDGGEDQINPANPVEFLSAVSILHFVDESDPKGCFKYGAGRFIVGENVGVSNLSYEDLYQKEDFFEPIFQSLTFFTIAMKYTMFRMLKPDKSLKRTSYYKSLGLDQPSQKMTKLLEDLKLFWNEYKTWIEELCNKNNAESEFHNSHTISMFSTEENLDILVTGNEEDANDSRRERRRKQNKAVDGSTIDAMINGTLDKFKKGNLGFNLVTEDKEFLLLIGLFYACRDKDDIIKPLFYSK
ncbi:MAG: hypothetical protein J6X58_03110 [Bacteroidales bacterium]|nr:hypothetical protein [Bacteroidales bacterium]